MSRVSTFGAAKISPSMQCSDRGTQNEEMAGVKGVRHDKYLEEEHELQNGVRHHHDHHDGRELRRSTRRSTRRSSAEDKEREDLNAYLLIGSAIQNTGAHGIPNIARANSMPRRLFWSFLFIGGMAVFFWQSVLIITAYANFEVITNLDEVYATELRFPAITICNLNPYASSKAGMYSQEFADAVGVPYNDGSGVVVGNVTSAAPSTSGTTQASSTERRYQDWDNVDFNQLDSRVSQLEIAQQIIGSAPYDDRNETGHELDDMLLDCNFENYPCTPDNFSHFYNYMYGNCYTFNSGEFGKLLTVSTVGPLYGLSLELYIQQCEYISTLQPSAGLRLLVHDQDEMPFPEDQGINLAPGAHTSVGMSLVNLERKEHPYTNCSSEFKPGNIFKDKFRHLSYSRSACEKDCFFDEVWAQCGCANVKYRYNESLPACNSTHEDCVDDVEKNYTSGRIACGCTMPCFQDIYEITVSEANWPNDGYASTVQENIESISDDLMQRVQDDGADAFINNNVVKVTIFYENLQYEYIYQTAAYGVYSLISDLGGQIGLWIGVSILTIFEFIELIYDLIKLVCLKLMDPHMKKKSAQSKTKKSDVMSLDVRQGHTNSLFSER